MTNKYPVKLSIPYKTTKTKGGTAIVGIVQMRPHPRLVLGHAVRWENDDNVLFPHYSSPAQGLPDTYLISLLVQDETKHHAGSRLGHAGYDGNPDSIVFRGRDLGETSATVNLHHFNGAPYFDWRVRGFDRATEGERNFLIDQLQPGIITAIEEGGEILRRDAEGAIKTRLDEEVRDARTSLDTLEKQAKEAYQALIADPVNV